MRDQLIGALIRHLEQLVIDDPLDESTTFGPQANAVHADTVRSRIAQSAQAGARIVAVGTAHSSGIWVAPTLVIDPSASLARGETFGPVLVIRTIASTAAAIEESYQIETGLAGYVFTRDLAEGQHVGAQLPAGEIKINGTSLLDMSDRSAQAFWYCGTASCKVSLGNLRCARHNRAIGHGHWRVGIDDQHIIA